MNSGSNSIRPDDANDYVEANPAMHGLKNGKVANMSLDELLEDNEDENGYLQPMSNPGNSTLVEEASYTNINTKNEHHYINSKYHNITQYTSIIKIFESVEFKLNSS